MATTSRFALRYPTDTYGPNVPQDIQNLASDVDAALPQAWQTLVYQQYTWSQALTSTMTTLSGFSGSVTVPNNHTLEVRFRAPAVHITGGTANIQLVLGGNVADIGQYSIGTGDLWVPVRLDAAVVGTGASVTIAVQGDCTAGSATVTGGNVGDPILTYRIV